MLTDAAKALLHHDLARLAEHGDAFANGVFEAWFAGASDAERLFQTHSFSTKREMIDATLIAVHDLAEGASWLRWDLAAFGARHAGTYEVRDEMYGDYVDAVLASLRGVLGGELGAEREATWRDALSRIARAMQRWHRLDEVAEVLARPA